MRKIIDENELYAVIKGFITYMQNNAENGYGICHPFHETVMLYSDDSTYPHIRITDTFLSSTDLKNWTCCDLEEMIDIVSDGGDYFIADLKCNVYMPIYYHMLKDIVQLFSKELPVICFKYKYWEDVPLGDIKKVSYSSISNYLKEINLNFSQHEEDNTTEILMRVEDVFTIQGRTCIAEGVISDRISVGDHINVFDENMNLIYRLIVDGIALNRKLVDYAIKGDKVGIKFCGVDIERGQILIKEREYTNKFSMEIEDVFEIKDRGTVVTGVVSGKINVGDYISLFDNKMNLISQKMVYGIELNRKLVDYAITGDSVGVLLKVPKSDIEIGYIIGKNNGQ